MKKITFLLVFISIFGYAQTPITNANIQTAVDLWVSDPSAATTTYGDISTWETSNVTNMTYLFNNKQTFNDAISNWDVSNVTDMRGMFKNASNFNQFIGDWDTSSVTSMSSMFSGATAFNRYINDWVTSSVTLMSYMFSEASAFNQPLNDWDTSSVTLDCQVSDICGMEGMFFQASAFNQPLNNWDTSSVDNMDFMFQEASSFNQNLSAWCVTNIFSVTPTQFSFSSPLSESNKPVWGTCPILGIDDQNFTNISIYPNPTNNTLFISGNETPIAVAIYNVLGKEVLSIKNTNNINVQALPSGVYVIRISDGVHQTNRKFIKN
jgi:surface protein